MKKRENPKGQTKRPTGKETLPVRKTESIFDEIDKMHERIMHRAHDIFLANGGVFGKDLENWLSAERELVWKPAMELREKGNEFLLTIAVPGIEAKDLDIEVTADNLLVKGEHHNRKEKKGKVYACEFESGSLFLAVHFPKKIDPDKVKAEFKNGMLRVTAPITAKQRTKRVKIGNA